MRVLTWNLWWQFGPWEERKPAIEAVVKRTDADVALFQEVWADDENGDQAAQLAEQTGHHMVRTVDREGRPQKFGNAILSRWPIVASEMIRLSGQDGRPSHRSALAARVETPAGPQLFVVTHLAWQYDAAPLRLRQLQEVVDLVVRLGPGQAEEPGEAEANRIVPPPVVAGDFNAVPESDEIRRMTGITESFHPGSVFTDCWAAVGDGPGHTWTRDNPHAADALWPRRRLDYVFVGWPRPKPLGNPLSAALVGVAPEGGIVPSDHYGLVVDLDDRTHLQDG